MGEKKKSAWIDAENRIVSFHAIDSGKVIQETESLFWDFVRGLMSAGYRIMWQEYLQIAHIRIQKVPICSRNKLVKYSVQKKIPRQDRKEASNKNIEIPDGLHRTNRIWAFPRRIGHRNEAALEQAEGMAAEIKEDNEYEG